MINACMPEELSDVPLGELQRIRLKVGTKRFDSALKTSLEERKARSFKRANKNRHVIVHSRVFPNFGFVFFQAQRSVFKEASFEVSASGSCCQGGSGKGAAAAAAATP